MTQKKRFILNSFIIGVLVALSVFLIYKNVRQPTVIKKDNLTLFLATDGSVVRSQELEAEKVKKIAIYFPETKPNNYQNHERYQIFLDDNAFMETMYERTIKTGDIFAAYVFHPNKKFSQNFIFAVKQEYLLNPAHDNAIEYAVEYKDNRTKRQVEHYYEYYPNTKFNENPEKNIKEIYYVQPSGIIDYSVELEKGTGRQLAKHYYEPKTAYDTQNFSHRQKITRTETLVTTSN